MSTTMYAKQNPSPAGTRRSQISTENTGNSSRRTTNRRSLSDRLRNLFRRNSASPNRTTSNDRRPPTIPASVRQDSPSPTSGRSSTDAPQLRAPAVHWPFGKKKPKLSTTTTSTPTSNKKKMKGSRKVKQTPVPPMEISSPVYQQQNQTLIYGQHFTPRTPEVVHENTGRLQSLTNYEITTTKGFRDYVVVDQTQQYQQVIVSDPDVFTPLVYTSDRSRSPSMNRPRLPTTNNEYRFYHDNPTSTASIPLADIEVIPTPPRKRKVGDTPPSPNIKILAEKPPISPQTSSRSPPATQPSSIITNPTQWKKTSSSTLNNSRVHSTASPSTDVDVPKLNAPLIPFGSASNKKKAKRTKSQSRTDGMTSSSSNINRWTQQNPSKPNQSWTKTYGSLPDAEIIYGSSLTSLQPSKPSISRYPGLSAIVQHHLRPAPVYYNERSSRTPTASPQRSQRFDTSTTTLNEYEQNQSWSQPIGNGSAPSTSSLHRHDGYIRPMTPQKPSVQPDVGIIRVDDNDLRGRSPPPRPSRYDSPEPPTTYRSSATIYTRDRHHYVDGGEIRTWSSRENNVNDDYNDSYQKVPYAHIQINIKREQETDGYDHRIVPTKIKDNYDEYRYSPRAHEQELYKKEQQTLNDQEIHEEERYEISYEYERQHQQYSYDTRTQYDELQHATNRYTNDIDNDHHLSYSNLTPATRSPVINEREKIYDQSSRSYTSSERIQEPLDAVAPINNSEEIARTYTLKRSDSYDGLGISISAGTPSSSNHFIRDVEQGSPGHRAGLRKNDRIINVNGVNVENVDFSNVLILIKQGLDNDNLQLSVIHEPEYN